ncbi:MAG: tetratricopeptide repeat protein [Candidatus Omnitrophica bacterium]|nr:tetratricopeptide repeat protein [Candidatus Omnitrophota bacterium]
MKRKFLALSVVLFFSSIVFAQDDEIKLPKNFFGEIIDSAISNCSEIIKVDPTYASAYYNRAVAYCGKGNYDQAISDFTKAIELDPDWALAYHSRGIAYGNKGDKAKEAADHVKARELDDKSENGNAIVQTASQVQRMQSQKDKIVNEEYEIYSACLASSVFGDFKAKTYIVIPGQTTVNLDKFKETLPVLDRLLTNMSRLGIGKKHIINRLRDLNQKAYRLEDRFMDNARVYFMPEAEYKSFKKNENGNLDWDKINKKYPDAAIFNVSRAAFSADQEYAIFYFSVEGKSGSLDYYQLFHKVVGQFLPFTGWSCGASAKASRRK